MQVKIKKLHPDAKVPAYAKPGDACFDLHALEKGGVWGANTFRTGLAFEIPEGHAMLVFSRSGHGFAHDTRLANCVGVIDSGYRGEVKVRMRADGVHSPHFEAGERIAQAMILPIPVIEFVEAEELSSTERGEGGFGSTGK